MKRLLVWSGLIGLVAWAWRRNQQRANPTSIKNKVVIITGASAGIGKAVASAFADAGAQVVLVARRANLLEDLKNELQQPDGQVLAIPADLTIEADMQRVVDETLDTFGRIDVLVNNAGLGLGGTLEDQDADFLHKMVNLNLYAPMRLTQLVIPTMKRQHSGHIVNISSTAGIMRVPGQETYSATKTGLNAFSDGLRRELINTGIRVSIIMPGWTDTAMIEQVNRDKMLGVRQGLIELQSSDYVADATVDAVRYNKKRVLLGGIGFIFMDLGERLHPELADWMYQFGLVDKDDMVDMMGKLG